MNASRVICFLSDYGYGDGFGGVCRAVVKSLAPDVHVIDITHGIAAHDVLGGAFVLRNTLPYMPEGAVLLAVVDPGVGGTRRSVALRSAGDHYFVGPDNGLLVPAAERDGGVTAAVELDNKALWLSPLSATFHGRDIFAPVAARLATGMPLSAAGSAVDPADLVRLDVPAARLAEGEVEATAVLIDRFGNVALDLNADLLEQAGLWGTIEVVRGGEAFLGVIGDAFSAVRLTDIVVLIDSYGQVAVCVNEGSAKDVLSLRVGDRVILRRREEE